MALDLVSEPARDTSGPRHPLAQTYQWELEKLSAQFRTRAAVLVALLGPLLFGVGLTVSSSVPADTLFGRWVGDSGFAIPLVVLGFAGSWAFPLLTCLVAGDIFSAEDHYSTWTSILTRSISRRGVFTGKVLAAATYAVVVLVLLALSSLAAGVLLIGHQSLIGLSGNVVSPGHAVALVLASWTVALPGVLVAATLGIVLSVLSRNSLAGIVGPTVAGLVFQLLLLVPGLGPVRGVLPNASFIAWHGLWADPAFTGPVLTATVADLAYAAVFLGVAWWSFHRRDIAT